MSDRRAFINAVAGAVPGHDVHRLFIDWAEGQVADERLRKLFRRMADRAGIEHRWSVLPEPAGGGRPDFYAGDSPPTSARMQVYAEAAPELALRAIANLRERAPLDGITHLVVASCTGFTAPGIDQIVARELGLAGDVERLMIGFMGCYAGATALRTAGQLARADEGARVLVVAVELSSLHLQAEAGLESTLAMAQFSDGAAAAIVSTEGPGLAIGEGLSATLEDSGELITWAIGDTGFEMGLSGEVPGRLAHALADPALAGRILDGGADAIDAWAVHPGGKSILDAVERSLGLPQTALAESREVLRTCGNMSSATILFVLERIMPRKPASGVALAFGPGLAMEGFRFGWTDCDAG